MAVALQRDWAQRAVAGQHMQRGRGAPGGTPLPLPLTDRARNLLMNPPLAASAVADAAITAELRARFGALLAGEV